jgi:hypothetical protein
VFSDDSASAECTNWARQVAKSLPGRTTIMGFSSAANPTAIQGWDGHDFAVVDDRYIVDGWLKALYGADQTVFDLQDPSDAEAIAHFYGNPGEWVNVDFGG